ncbi:MAG: hypothetical protein ACKOBX_08940 [Bacteroidota bacterium]
MKSIIHTGAKYFDKLCSNDSIRRIELIILRIAVLSFVVHLAIIYIGNTYQYFGSIQHNYLKAIYTPFSFILFYEVFLLIVIIPQSISEFIGKQFEVITLITLRGFFHDIADFNFKNSFEITNTELIGLAYDLIASLLMLALTILYYKVYQKNNKTDKINELINFINIKKLVSIGMIFILLILSIGSFYQWLNDMIIALKTDNNYPDPNTVFYSDFFTIMIFVDVMLLLISFIYHFSFFTIFRNASFIITTILIRMSLTIEKPLNHLIVLAGFMFAIVSFYLYSLRSVHSRNQTD